MSVESALSSGGEFTRAGGRHTACARTRRRRRVGARVWAGAAMVRGNAKAKSQEKNAKKQAAKQKSGSQLNDQKKALKFVCPGAAPVGARAPLRADARARARTHAGASHRCVLRGEGHSYPVATRVHVLTPACPPPSRLQRHADSSPTWPQQSPHLSAFDVPSPSTPPHLARVLHTLICATTPGHCERARRCAPRAHEVCKVQMPQVKTMLVHWDSKHGKVPEPQEIKDMRTSVA